MVVYLVSRFDHITYRDKDPSMMIEDSVLDINATGFDMDLVRT